MKRRGFYRLLGGIPALIAGLPDAGAQQKAMPLIGWLGIGAASDTAPFIRAFLEGLGDIGYIDGQNVAIEYRWAGDRYDRLPVLATELVQRKVDLIVSGGGTAVGRAAKSATATIPIVFVGGDDPVAGGLVPSLARPGGNLTGASVISVELDPKRLELLHELAPAAGVIGVLLNPNSPSNERRTRDLLNVAQRRSLQLQFLMAGSAREIEAAFTTMVERKIGGLLVGADSYFTSQREQLVSLASRHAIPATYPVREFATAGGLLSYGASRAAVFRQAGNYAGRILKGAKPADLPVLQPTVFELVVNMKTAKALGLTMPPSILARADEVIE
jgi:putative ABC transport system substrate-binding protein